MPAVTISSRGTNVVLSDDEAEAEALVALRECDREIARFDATGDEAARRLATNLYLYANMLLAQVADRAP